MLCVGLTEISPSSLLSTLQAKKINMCGNAKPIFKAKKPVKMIEIRGMKMKPVLPEKYNHNFDPFN